MCKSYKLYFLIIWILLIILASLIDYGSMPQAMKATVQFKRGYIVHFGAYFFASYLIWVSFESIMALVLGLNSSIFLLGIILEFLQKLAPTRTFNKVDIYMNLSGILCFNFLLISFYFAKKWRASNE